MQEPVIIVGDIHGQYYDLIHMFEKVVDQRKVPKYEIECEDNEIIRTKLLFLGDYVDRGMFSIEVLIFLYSLKVQFRFTTLRICLIAWCS
jgi:serine/threonine-protein phosphatase 2B catalytic subunit